MSKLANSDHPLGHTAIVFAHPAHEWFNCGLLLRLQPDLLFLSRGAFENVPSFDTELADSLAKAGFHGSITFCEIKEQEIFDNYLRQDTRWFLGLRDVVASWLNRNAPQVVMTDALERYNSAHDLAPLLVASALKALGSGGSGLPTCYEVGIAFHTLSNENLESIQQCNPQQWLSYRLTDDEQLGKRELFSRAHQLMRQLPTCAVNDSPDKVAANWPTNRFTTEFYRRVPDDRDFRVPLSAIHWPTYDERGVQRVLDGRSSEAVNYANHFLPVVRALIGESHSCNVSAA